jgi:hypothetical protein
MIQAMIACAPDFATLCYVAAGPVEDLMMDESMWQVVRQEAEINRRVRLCLRGAYGLPKELQRLADTESEGEPLPSANAVEMTSEEAAVMVAYFQYHDTFWAAELLEEWTEHDPDAAWLILELLIKIGDDKPFVREDVFLHAFEPFVRWNLSTYQPHLKEMVLRNLALRQWLSGRTAFSDSGWRSLLPDATFCY